MNRRVLLMLIVLLTLPVVFSALDFVVEETELVSLQPDASDPDSDSLIWTYSAPLDDDGQWQTTYGDAGQYKSVVTVSDGVNSDSREVTITVIKKEEKPTIESFIPSQDEVIIDELSKVDFRILASDLNNDELRFSWLVDGKNVASGEEFSYSTGYSDAGNHEVVAEVSDAVSRVSKKWTVIVNEVDATGLLESIPDVEINEGETASLSLPDFESYGIAYTISEPVGNDNQWKTGFDDEGVYNVRVHAEARGFNEDKSVKVVVHDVDLPPEFEGLSPVVAGEGEQIEIELRASDPDRDKISFSAQNMPKGAVLEDNVFKWTPQYDTVTSQGFTDWLMGLFGTLSETSYVKFTASSKDSEIIQNAIITVQDVNRAPEIEDIAPIRIKEAQTLRLSPKVYDPDGDKVKVKYSGLSNTNTFVAGYNDAGTYIFTVTASDGDIETSREVQVIVEDINRPPVISLSPEAKIPEGETLVILLEAQDADGDIVNYTLDNPPNGSYIRGNAFFWTPDYNTATSGFRAMDLVFVAKDKASESRDVVRVTVENKNRPPRITEFSQTLNARVNKPVLMSVEAADDDGDALTYIWDFNLLEKYEAKAMQRVFTTKGLKKVKIIVSDGIDEVEQLVSINVV